MNSVTFDSNNDTLIVVPTVADPSVLLPSMHLLVNRVPARTRIMVSINPDSVENAAKSIQALRVLRAACPNGVTLDMHVEDGLRGFGGAINIGLRAAIQSGGLPEYVLIFNDDLRVTPGWLTKLLVAINSDDISLCTEPPVVVDGKLGSRPVRDRKLYGKIGMIGPCSNQVAGIQQVALDEDVLKQAMQLKFGHDQMTPTVKDQDLYDSAAAVWHTQNPDTLNLTCNFLSGFCMMIRRDCLLDIWLEGNNGPMFDADNYPIAGYEDNDLCHRVMMAGWRLAVARGVFIGHLGHQTFDRAFPEMMRGMRNRENYYRKWKKTGSNRMISIYRVAIRTVQDLHYWRNSIAKACSVSDGIAVLLTNNPLEIQSGSDWNQMHGSLQDYDIAWLRSCSNANSTEVANATMDWIKSISKLVGFEPDVSVECWEGFWNERDERNRAIELGIQMDADWLLSIDHDEVIEDQVTRYHFERLFNHPDPLVDGFEFGWLNHWESPRMIRVDRPWGDGGSYSGGMSGTRLWRVNKANPRKIIAGTEKGLHCGNCPDSGNGSRRVANIRFRHFGYMHSSQRTNKYAWYSKIDPNPDAVLVGGNDYSHIVAEEGMKLRPYVPHNRIGFYMLTHSGESPEDVAMWLNDSYSMSDAMVLVWTGEWSDEDKHWLDSNVDELDIPENEWPETGPGRTLAAFAKLYDVIWVHSEFDDDLSECRNAALNQLQTQGVDWAWFQDADERFQGEPTVSLRCIRSMVETSDGWGWMFRFRNFLRGAPASMSESLRITRLDASGIMRMNSRVHEGFDAAVKTLRKNGVHPMLRYAPFTCNHFGLTVEDDKLEGKLNKYRRMLVKELEDNPHNSGAWVSLGLQFANDGNLGKAQECYERGVACAGESYLAFKELGVHHLRLAKALLVESAKRTTKKHPWQEEVVRVVEAFGHLTVQSRVGNTTLPDIELPSFSLPDEMVYQMIEDGLIPAPTDGHEEQP